MIHPPQVRAARQIIRDHAKTVKRARPKSPKKDRGRVRDNGYLAWLRRQPCALLRNGTCYGPVQAAHIRTHKPGELPTGLQRKPDDQRATPLCQHHHALQHAGNEMRFWTIFGLDPFAIAERLYAEYQSLTPASQTGDGDE